MAPKFKPQPQLTDDQHGPSIHTWSVDGDPSMAHAICQDRSMGRYPYIAQDWRTRGPVGNPDPNRNWTQDNFKVESVKLGEPRKLLANR
uniref:Uncharacterized protein n=1 Tax=Solanum tuberosum TaxID=4113 RepID=M1DGX4_SOLTU